MIITNPGKEFVAEQWLTPKKYWEDVMSKEFPTPEISITLSTIPMEIIMNGHFNTSCSLLKSGGMFHLTLIVRIIDAVWLMDGIN